jgi:methionyl-tRNA formyltransferase
MTQAPLSSGALRLVICTKYDLAGALILNHLLPRLRHHQVMVLLSDKVRDAETSIPELSILKFLERDLPLGTLFALIDHHNLAAPTTTTGPQNGGKLTFRGLSDRYQIPFHRVDDINSPHWLGALHDFRPDFTLSVRFSNVFRAEAIAAARFGTFNVHPGALPRYAGLFPSFRALLDGQTQIGSTLHRMDEVIDAGPVLGIVWTPMVAAKGLLWHVFKSYYGGLDLFVDLLPQLSQGLPVEEVPQDLSQRQYRSMPAPEEVRRFFAHGLQLFDPACYQATLHEFLPPQMDKPPCF